MTINKEHNTQKDQLPSILAVDDEIRVLESLQTLLGSHGYQISTAQGGKEACRQLLKGNFDLVLLDLNMADMDGHQVMEFVTRNQIHTAVIVVSGESSFASASKALRRGAHDYVRKPYVIDELISTIEKTAQKIMLEKVHVSMQKRLEKSEELHRYIVNTSPDIVFMLDPTGHFTFLNNKIESILGYRKSELLGRPIQDIIDPNDTKRASYIIEEQQSPRGEAAKIELRMKAQNESHASRFFELTLFPIENRNAAGNAGTLPIMGIYGTARDITERKEAEDFINFQAYHDLLTRLPNRTLFKDRLNLAIAQARRGKQMLAVMFLDLDRFKVVNDSLGHAMGDRLLQSVAMRLENCIRSCDTLSRFGGDEFTLLLPSISSADDARIIARKLIKTLKDPFQLGPHEVFVGVSIGIALYPEGGDSVDQLVQNADLAMYHVKGRGKDGYQFYSDAMMTSTPCNRLQMERDLRIALEREEFRVYFQPQVNAQTEEIIGVEALVRWQHPERGLIFPGEFLPLAEETRLMTAINNWVLEASCREVKHWFEAGHREIRLAVNFSPSQVEHPKFVQNLMETLNRVQFPPEKLEIELTENVVMNDLENMTQKLSQLSDAGVTIAIDDFGTGYSSLNYLHRLPIHTLKVDQSFIRDLGDSPEEACIVNAIVSMAHGLKLNIVAEGVENSHQLDYLRSLGCQEVQGFYFGRAEPAQKIFEKIYIDKHCKVS
jgi:diguanylate cyclase (GGDEF)-like protein/PAS domain S-box-containing protein